MLHEAGHVSLDRHVHDHRCNEWYQAMQADGHYVSEYSKWPPVTACDNVNELHPHSHDRTETLHVWLATRVHPEVFSPEDLAYWNKALYGRFTVLDSLIEDLGSDSMSPYLQEENQD